MSEQQEIIGSGLDREQPGHGVDPALEEVAISIYVAESRTNTRERWLDRDSYLDRNKFRLAARDAIAAKGKAEDPEHPEDVDGMVVEVKSDDGETRTVEVEPPVLDEPDASDAGGVVTLTGGGKSVDLAQTVEPDQPEPEYVEGEAAGAEGDPKKDADASNDNELPAGEAMIKPVEKEAPKKPRATKSKS